MPSDRGFKIEKWVPKVPNTRKVFRDKLKQGNRGQIGHKQWSAFFYYFWLKIYYHSYLYPSVCDVFSLTACKNFLFINFKKILLWCSLVSWASQFYSCFGFFGLLDLWIYSVHQMWNYFDHYFSIFSSKCFSVPPLLSYT